MILIGFMPIRFNSPRVLKPQNIMVRKNVDIFAKVKGGKRNE
jgi:hypothetical protein